MGFSVGLGTFAAGQCQGDIDNTFLLPGYVRVDALAAYRWNVKKSRVLRRCIKILPKSRIFEVTGSLFIFTMDLVLVRSFVMLGITGTINTFWVELDRM
jgi:hypothetical protein